MLCLLLLGGLKARTRSERTVIWVAAWGALLTVFVAIVFREINGDTWRYYMTFLQLRQQSFLTMYQRTEDNVLFVYLNWALGQFGSHPLYLLGPIALFCMVMLVRSLREMFSSFHAAILLFVYSMYPFLVFYLASGMKQGIAMVLLLHGYIRVFQGARSGWLWLISAPLFHSGALLVFPFIILQKLTFNTVFGHRRALRFSVLLLFVVTLLSITGLNETLLLPVQTYMVISDNYQIYFQNAEDFDYRAGFRPDFTLFSLVPLAAGYWLWRHGYPLTSTFTGWWLNFYILLISIYQVFSFAPFADRFAGFGWFIMPLVLMVMVVESQDRRVLQWFLLGFVLSNLLLLQFYTGRVLTMGLT